MYRNSLSRLVWWLAALFLTVVGAKLWLIHCYAAPVIYLDQWNEADNFIKPWREGHLAWHNWIAAHNVHRIFFTRGLDLLSIQLNGEWDPLFQMTVNALFHAGILCGLVGLLWVFTGGQDLTLLCLLFAPFLALPLAAENTLWSFQSQFYFLIFFGIAAMAGLGFHPPGSRWWWGGLCAAILGLFTMASGFLAPLAVAGLLGLRSLQGRRLSRESLITLAACGAIAAGGAALAVHPKLSGEHAWGGILAALAWMLAWPFENKPVLLWFVCLPLALTAVKYFRGAFKDPRAAEFLLALGFWSGLQMACIAYARTDQVNSSRYVDLFCFLPMAGLASLFLLVGEWREGVSRGRQIVLAAGWTILLLGGLWQASPRDWRNFDAGDNYSLWTAQAQILDRQVIRTLVGTGNPAPFQRYPHLDLITNLLNDPLVARILPADYRPPLAVAPDAGTDAAFALGGCVPERPPREFSRAWGNWTTNGAMPGRFVSQPISARLPRLQLELWCATNTENVRVELVEQASGRRIPVRPQVFGQWQELNVATPGNPFRLELTVGTPAGGVAVGALRESGYGSYVARRIQTRSALLLLAGLVLFAGLIGNDLRRRAPGLPSPMRWLALLLVLVALLCVWPQRNFDATQLAGELMANCAKNSAQDYQVGQARSFLREALWLRPDDPELKDQMRALSQPVSSRQAAPGQ